MKRAKRVFVRRRSERRIRLGVFRWWLLVVVVMGWEGLEGRSGEK